MSRENQRLQIVIIEKHQFFCVQNKIINFCILNRTIIVLFSKKVNAFKLSTTKNHSIVNRNFEITISFVEIMIDQNSDLKIVTKNLNHDFDLNLIIDLTNRKVILNINQNLNRVNQTDQENISDINFDFVLKIVSENIDFVFHFVSEIDIFKKNVIIENTNFIIVFLIVKSLNFIIAF